MKIAFVSTSNAARSILAENICALKYPDLEVYSAGTDPRSHLVCDTSKTLFRNYEIMTDSFPKSVDELPENLDIVVLMGKDVDYQSTCSQVVNFELLDPIHKLDEIFDMTCVIIELKLQLLLQNM